MRVMALYLVAMTGAMRQHLSAVDVRLDAQTVAMLSGIVIPLLVAVISKMHASDGLKAVLNALLSAVAGTLAAFSQDGFFHSDLKTVAVSILSTWVVSVATYYGVFKPTGIAGTVAAKTAKFGIGSPPVLETEDRGAEEGDYRPEHRRP